MWLGGLPGPAKPGGPPGPARGGSGRAPFLVMAKPVGPLCNLECTYCYYLGKKALFPPGERFRMRPEVLESFLQATVAASPGPVIPVVWHGGEPLLAGRAFYERALEAQARLLPPGWSWKNIVQTNGTLLDESWASFLAAHRFAVGISLDGPPELHDAGRPDRRGRPSAARALRGFRLLRAQGIEPDVLCTLNAATAAHPVEVYRYFLDIGVRELKFLPVVSQDRSGRPTPQSVSPEAMGEFLCTVFDEWVRFDVGRISVQNFLECLLVAAGRPPNLCTMAETCGRVLALEHDGGVYACDHFVDPAHRRGSIGEEDIEDLLEDPAQVAFGEAKRDALPEECRECPVLTFCRGGCPKDRFAPSAGGPANLSYLCAGYRRFYGHVAPYVGRMAALARAGRPPAAVMEELARAEAPERRRWREAPRNGPCPCGSGRRFKSCCWGTRRR